MVRLNLDLGDLAAELQGMAEVLGAVEEGESLEQFPDAQRPEHEGLRRAMNGEIPSADQASEL